MGSAKQAIDRASQVLDELGIADPDEIDIELIAGYHDLLIDTRPMEGREGHLICTMGTGLIVVDEAAFDSHKWRFVVAHELGHFLLHEETDQFHLCTSAEAHLWYRASGLEAQANAFASEILLPRRFFLPRVHQTDRDDPTLDAIGDIARRFRTSLTATALAYLRHTECACALVCSRVGRVQWVQSSEAFLPKIRERSKLGRDTYAAALWRGEGVPNAPLPNSAKAWSGTLRAAHLTLFEHTIKLDAYGIALTWLWHD